MIASATSTDCFHISLLSQPVTYSTPGTALIQEVSVLRMRRSGVVGLKGFDLGDGGGVKTLQHGDEEIDGAVEVGAIDDAIVGVRRARRDEQGGNGNTWAIEFDGAGIVAEALDEIVLQWNLAFSGDLLHEFD